MSNFYNFMGLFLMSFIPLMVVAIGAMMSEKGGVTNIALGYYDLGAFGVLVVKFLVENLIMLKVRCCDPGRYLIGLLVAAGILVHFFMLLPQLT